MAYIGRTPDIGNFEKQVLTPDSVTTTFALTFAVGSANSLLVVYGGVTQEPGVAYSVSGGGQQIVFSEAPVTGTTTYIIYLGKQLTTPRAAGQETTKQTFAGDGSTVTFTLTDPPVVPAGIMVFVDGILQREGSGNNYVSSGSTITFTSAPDSSAEIDVYTLVKEKVSIDTVADGSITVTKLAAGHPTWNGAGETVIATASTGNSLRITNTGSGNSLLVEDSASTDASPFVVDATGNVGIGTSSPAYKLDVKGNIRSGLASTTSGEISFFSASNDSQMGLLNNATEFKIYSTYATTAGYKPINFYTSDALKMTLDADGDLGIGTTPSAKLHIFGDFSKNTADENTWGIRVADSTSMAAGVGGGITFTGKYLTGGGQAAFAAIAGAKENGTSGNITGKLNFYTTNASGVLVNNMTLDTSGKLNVAGQVTSTGGIFKANGAPSLDAATAGEAILAPESTLGALLYGRGTTYDVVLARRTTNVALGVLADTVNIHIPATLYLKCTATPSASVFGSAFIDNGVGAAVLHQSTSITSANALQAFYNPNGNVGSLGTSGSNAYFATTSDYRLKNTITPMTGALAKVALLKPVTYKWNADGSDSQGFIAHELAEVCPQAVIGEKDDVETYTDEDGDEQTRPKYQSVDTSFLVATLTAAIQELKAIVDAQAVEIAALKAK